MDTRSPPSTTTKNDVQRAPESQAPAVPGSPEAQLQALLDAERKAHEHQPRSFKDDALTDKVVTVAPDGTGPTSTATFDPEPDQAAGSGSPVPD
jgi:hypothetical protein